MTPKIAHAPIAAAKMTNKNQKHMTTHIENKTARENKSLPFKIGADPEFLFFYGNRALNAQNIIEYFCKNATLPKTNMGYKIGEHGSIGWDGHSSTGEIRPTASKNIYDVVNNIGAIIKTTHAMGPFIDMTTLSIGSPIGGHIHVDITDQLLENGDTPYHTTRFMQKIQKLVATFLIPILASDHKICAANRTLNNSYGQQGDLRLSKPLGNNSQTTTMEIRGPSAEWMTNPKIAAATLAYIGVVWNEIRENHTALAKTDIAIKNQMQITSLQHLVLSEYQPLMKMLIAPIAKQVKTFALYPQFKEEIDFILNVKAVYAEKEKNGWNLANGWGLQQSTSPTKRTILSTQKTKQMLKDKNTDLFAPSLPILYNDDRNVSIFAETLREKIVAFNWGLKNTYFFFGLAKNANAPMIMRTQHITTSTLSDNILTCTGYTLPDNIAPDHIQSVMYGMNERSKLRLNNLQKTLIDPKTGKKNKATKDIIVFGLTYEMREEKNTRSFLETIWNLEHNKIKEKQFTITAQEKTTQNSDSMSKEDIETIGNMRQFDITNSVASLIEPDENESEYDEKNYQQ